MISRKVLVALDCSSSSSCCSRALGSTSAPPDTDPVFTTLQAPGIFHPEGPAELWQRKPRHEVVSCGQESWRSARRADEAPRGKEALAGNVGRVRRAGSPRQSTGTATSPHCQPGRGTRIFSWTLLPIRGSAHIFSTRQTQHSKQPLLGTAKLWVFSINP